MGSASATPGSLAVGVSLTLATTSTEVGIGCGSSFKPSCLAMMPPMSCADAPLGNCTSKFHLPFSSVLSRTLDGAPGSLGKRQASASMLMFRQTSRTVGSAGSAEGVALQPVSPDPSASFICGFLSTVSMSPGSGLVSWRIASLKRSASNDCSISRTASDSAPGADPGRAAKDAPAGAFAITSKRSISSQLGPPRILSSSNPYARAIRSIIEALWNS